MESYKNLILGGGVAAGYAAKAFVEGGLKPGRLAIVSAENRLPYDRPSLSKDYLLGKTDYEEILINDAGFYAENGIVTLLGRRAIGIDFDLRQLRLEDGMEIAFDQLLIATGSNLRRFDLPGADLQGIHYLRNLAQAKGIRQAAHTASRAVVIGGSFIGMEVTSGVCQQGVATTMVFPEQRVWEAFFTPLMSSFFQDVYRDRGVEFLTGATVESFDGEGSIRAVDVRVGDERRTIPADMAVAGIGVEPDTGLFMDTGLALDEGILVDRFLETNITGVFAAGDVARFPDAIFGDYRRIEHWDNAATQGGHAARMMLGEREPFVHVPYFFSDVFDLSYEFWGDNSQANKIVSRGEVQSGSFSVWWLREDRLLAAFVMDRPEEERQMAKEWIRNQQPISAERLVDTRYSAEEITLTPA